MDVDSVSQVEVAFLRAQNERLLGEIGRLKQQESNATRDVIVLSMCQCNSGNMAIPYNVTTEAENLNITQQASLATGHVNKQFKMKASQCKCLKDQ